ncbi:MAG: Crp/Fnr family transcriptional regulator [Sphingobacteriales bacterium]|nr:MAG: Crp/Fnr family transcriptional regulator [Sphingobacteriales bacterium]
MAKATCDLRSCFLCTHSSPEWRELTGLKKSTKPFKKGASIFEEGGAVEGIYFLYEGSAKIHMKWGDEKELILRFAKRGDILGYRGLGKKHIYPVSATALENCSACFISNDFLEATLKSSPVFALALLEIYEDELQKAERRMRDLVHMDVKGRVALALTEIAEIFGTNSEQFINIPILRQDIASYAGTTYETVFKLLTDFSAKKMISTSGKQIRIDKPVEMKELITNY